MGAQQCKKSNVGAHRRIEADYLEERIPSKEDESEVESESIQPEEEPKVVEEPAEENEESEEPEAEVQEVKREISDVKSDKDSSVFVDRLKIPSSRPREQDEKSVSDVTSQQGIVSPEIQSPRTEAHDHSSPRPSVASETETKVDVPVGSDDEDSEMSVSTRVTANEYLKVPSKSQETYHESDYKAYKGVKTRNTQMIHIDKTARNISRLCGCALGDDHDENECDICQCIDLSDSPLLN